MGWAIAGSLGPRISPSAVIGPVQTISQPSALRLVDINGAVLASGAALFVESVGDYFVLDKTSTATADGITVVEARGGGRWFRLLTLNTRWLQQTMWFLDAAGGDDENDGASAATALRSSDELGRRINGGTITVNTTVTVTAGSYSSLVLDLLVASGVVFTVQGAVVGVATGTLSAVNNSVPATFGSSSTRGDITNTGGDPAFVDKTRLRLTSGANADALARVTRAIAADNANVSRWARTNPAVTTLPTIGNAAVNDTYAVESLGTSFQHAEITCRGAGRILVRECVFEGSGTANRCRNDAGTLGGVYFYACEFTGTSCLWHQGEGLFVSCAFQSSITVFQNAYVSLRANVFTSVGGLTLDGGAVANLARSNCFDGAAIIVHFAWLEFTGTPGDCEFSDQTAASITTWPGGFVDNDSGCILWGANNSTTNTIVVRSLSPGIAPAALNLLNIPGGTNDTLIGGTATAYGDLPFYNTARGCGIVLRA